jgi:hypothetical protein
MNNEELVAKYMSYPSVDTLELIRTFHCAGQTMRAAAKQMAKAFQQSFETFPFKELRRLKDKLEREERHAKAQRVWSSWSGKYE